MEGGYKTDHRSFNNLTIVHGASAYSRHSTVRMLLKDYDAGKVVDDSSNVLNRRVRVVNPILANTRWQKFQPIWLKENILDLFVTVYIEVRIIKNFVIDSLYLKFSKITNIISF